MSEIIFWALYGLLSLIVLLIGSWSKSQEKRIDMLENFKDQTNSRWEGIAKEYVAKKDFEKSVEEIKQSLRRIEDKIERLRGD